MQLRYIFSLLVLGSLFLAFFSCNPEEQFITSSDAKLEFSLDTLRFDTVFTERGSATRILKVFNPHSESIRISNIRLADDASPFRINVDGISTKSIDDVEIAGKDSLYIFGEVTIDPDAPVSNSPFVIYEDLLFETNGNDQVVKLEAWGQNAIYIPNRFSADSLNLITCDGGEITFGNEKPYVVFGVLFIDNCTLEILEGARIHFFGGFARIENEDGSFTTYNDGLLFILPDGKLKVRGTVEDPVIFEGDRLEEDFQDVQGQWAGIRLGAGSTGHELENAIIKNSIVGIRADSTNVSLKNVQMVNTSSSGLLSVRANITAENCLFHSNSGNAVQLEYGGNHNFKYCTLASFGVDASALRMTNLLCLDQFCSEYLTNPLSATFDNSIVFGSRRDEISLFGAPEDPFDYKLNNCIVRVDELDDADGNYTDFFEHCEPCINATFGDPIFADVDEDDYSLDTLSLAENNALPIDFIQLDIIGNERDSETPDIGCYEYQYE